MFAVFREKRSIPWIAAAMNFFIPGAGYIYLKRKTTFGLLLILSYIIAWSVAIDKPQIAAIFPAALVFSAALGFDAYNEAKKEPYQ